MASKGQTPEGSGEHAEGGSGGKAQESDLTVLKFSATSGVDG